MGSQVFYITVSDGQTTIYPGSGYGQDYDLAVGPDIVLRWFARRDVDDYGPDPWWSDSGCDGAALIDVDRRHLLLFAEQAWSNSGRDDYLYRRAILDAYGRTWPGWSIEWAYDGLGDVLRYLGRDPAEIRDGHSLLAATSVYDGEPWSDIVRFLVTVNDGDGCRAYGLRSGANCPWSLGPALLSQVPEQDRITACPTIPAAGLHLDAIEKTAHLWSITALCGLLEHWPTLWPGWDLRFWQDDPTEQLRRAPGITLPDRFDWSAQLDQLAKRVYESWPSEEVSRARGVDVDSLRAVDFAGLNPQFDVGLTAADLTAIADTIRGGSDRPGLVVLGR